jgi:nucleotide-binding universal stress UspA family protein
VAPLDCRNIKAPGSHPAITAVEDIEMFERIMVPLNGLASAEAAVAPAAAMARTHGAELHLVLVDGPSRLDPMSDEFFRVDCAAYRDGQMQPLADNLRHDLGIAVTTAMLAGPVVATLAHYASAVHADLIVMATHGRVGWRRAWVGSVADDLMHEVTIPLLLLRIESEGAAVPGSFRRILVPLDGSDAAAAALDQACTVARAGKSALILVRVVTPIPAEVNLAATAGVVLTDTEATQRLVDEAQQYVDGLADALRSREPMRVETLVELVPVIAPLSPVASIIATLARELRADLVALTTHGRGASRLLVGSVGDKVLHDTHCALLICHGRVSATSPMAKDARPAQATIPNPV